jgi:dihydrofolate reductase
MKLTTVTNVSVDGVMQGLGGSDEDRRGGFERGGWALPLFERDDQAGTFLGQVYQRADAFLFGRRTYEIFAGSWGTRDDPGDSPIWTALNTRPKYVASTTLTDPQWADTTVLSGDVAAAVGELKAKPAGELQVHGSGSLVRWLLDNRLVDEITLLTYPMVIGQGTRLFPADGPDVALDLVDSRATPMGVTIQVYRPAGRPQYATATDVKQVKWQPGSVESRVSVQSDPLPRLIVPGRLHNAVERDELRCDDPSHQLVKNPARTGPSASAAMSWLCPSIMWLAPSGSASTKA